MLIKRSCQSKQSDGETIFQRGVKFPLKRSLYRGMGGETMWSREEEVTAWKEGVELKKKKKEKED